MPLIGLQWTASQAILCALIVNNITTHQIVKAIFPTLRENGEIQGKMNITITEATILILITPTVLLCIFGLAYASRIYRRPLLRTWLSVVYGTFVPLLVATYAFWHNLWIRGYLYELWWMAFIFWCAIGIPAIPMIIWQEKKFREQTRD